jgi:mannonate dehydratase
MKSLPKTWRWFGPNDPINLNHVKQTGVSGVVTALHDIPVGEIWQVDKISKTKQAIEAEGLKWSVVESLPVHENIKKRTGNYIQLIENYKISLKNLATQGINTVCYNYMPILDWSRTDLNYLTTEKVLTTRFVAKIFAAFDLFILERNNAEKNYSATQITAAKQYFDQMDEPEKNKLQETILLGLPGSLEAITLDQLKFSLKEYEDIGHDDLQQNLKFFLKEIIPVAEENGIFMAIHPDDPPWSLLGLPRIVSNESDIKTLTQFVDSPANGFSLCTGSLGVGYANDLVQITKDHAQRINFAHLRNVTRNAAGDFVESLPNEGDIDLYKIIRILLKEQNRRCEKKLLNPLIPMRPDHGHLMYLEKTIKNIYPGYSFIGRLRNLAEIMGMETAILRELNK